MKKRTFILGCLLSASLLGAADFTLRPAGQTGLNSVLASVNGEPVCLSDIIGGTRAKEYQLYATKSGAELQQAIQQLRKEAVDDWIDRKLLVQDFKDSGINLAPADVEYELDRIADRMGNRSRNEFIRQLHAEGLTEKEIREKVEDNLRCQLMIMRRINSAPSVTPREVYEYYEAHKTEFSAPAVVGLAMLRLPPVPAGGKDPVKEIAAELQKDPAKFDELVLKYQQEGNGSGPLGEIEFPRLRPEFSAVLAKAEKGRICGPISLPDGVVFLKVTSYQPAKAADFASVEPLIRAKLKALLREKVQKEYLLELRKKAVIQYFI